MIEWPVQVALSWGKASETAVVARFDWEWEGSHEVPMPRRGDRIAFGELETVVSTVTYTCHTRRSIGQPPVTVELMVRPTKTTRQRQFTPADIRTILGELASVDRIHTPDPES